MWVAIRSYEFSYEAELGRLRLESCGIDARVRDVESVSVMPHLSNALGGAKLEVRRADAELALELLDASEGKPAPDGGAYRTAGEVAPDRKKRKRNKKRSPPSPRRGEGRGGGQEVTLDPDLAERMRADAIQLPGDPIAYRAYNASLLGMFMCPGIAHLYAFSILSEIDDKNLELTDRGERHRRRARTISWLMLGVTAVAAIYALVS